MDEQLKPADLRVVHSDFANKLAAWCQNSLASMRAKAIMVLSESGHCLSSCGPLDHAEQGRFTALCLGCHLASKGLMQLLGEQNLKGVCLEADQAQIYLVHVPERAVVAVVFDQSTSLGFIKLRWQQEMINLWQLFENEVLITSLSRAPGEVIDLNALHEQKKQQTDAALDALLACAWR